MDCIQAIEVRRSVRKYKSEDIPDETIKKVLNSGRLAPSGGNMQPWEFILVKDKNTIEKIVELTFVGFNKASGHQQRWILTAPLLIVVCTDYKRTVARYGEMGRKIALMDTSAAIENMLLTATALGLGSCWVSGFDTKDLSELLQTPESVEPIAILPLGYPERVPDSPNKFPMDQIVHYEKYGNLDF